MTPQDTGFELAVPVTETASKTAAATTRSRRTAAP